MNAVRSIESGETFHTKCAPEGEVTEAIEIDGSVCAGCGDVIDPDPEDDPRTLEDEEEDA